MGVPFSEPDTFRRLRPAFGKGGDNGTTRDYEHPTLDNNVKGRFTSSDGRVVVNEAGQQYSQEAVWFAKRCDLQRDDRMLVVKPGMNAIFTVQVVTPEYDVRGKFSHFVASLSKVPQAEAFPDES